MKGVKGVQGVDDVDDVEGVKDVLSLITLAPFATRSALLSTPSPRPHHALTTDMMPPITDLTTLIRSMEPALTPGEYVFTSVQSMSGIDPAQIIALIREPEGISLIMAAADAERLGLPILFRCAWITLTVHSDLAAVGLTAAFAQALDDAGISCNVVAGAYHDHIFVPVAAAEQALAALRALQERA